MSNIEKGLLPIGNNFNLKSFVNEGSYVHKKAISEFDVFGVEPIPVNRDVIWYFDKINYDIMPISLVVNNTAVINNADSFIVSLKESISNRIIWELELANQKRIFGKTFIFEFPFLIISNYEKLIIRTTANLTKAILYGERVFLNPIIPPTTNI
jgi:hypothetical protein